MGEKHARKSCRIFSVKCHKSGHIAKVCNSAAVIVTPQEADDSAVVPISQTDKQPHADIPPMFQILHFTQMQRHLQLMLKASSNICIFASHGLPEQIVSDNSLQFTVKEFKDYRSSCSILHKTTAPYHPRLNGEVERLVETFKNSFRKQILRTSRTEVQDCVTNFLARYRATPYSVTGQTSSELLNGRKLRKLLDPLHPSQTQLQPAKKNSTIYRLDQGNSRQVDCYNHPCKWALNAMHYIIH